MEIDKKGVLVPIWNKAAYKIPKMVAFSKEGDLIYVFGLWDGIMYVVLSEFGLKYLIWNHSYTIWGTDGKQLSTKDTGLAM